MKKLIAILILLLLPLSGCRKQESSNIVATTLPVYEFASFICDGTDLAVTQLITENVSCLHDYSLQVAQMRAVESAEMIVINGAGLEDFLEDILPDAQHMIDASEGLELSCGHHHEGSEHHHEQDPHFWLSPKNAKHMCRTISDKLSAEYPQYADTFSKNLSKLLGMLDDLQAYGEQNLRNLSSRNLITFHDGFSYFAESFDLHILKAIEEESGSEASAKELIELINLVEESKPPAIFTETNGSTSAAEIIAEETGVKVFALDMAMAGNSYFKAMYHNIDTIKEALE